MSFLSDAISKGTSSLIDSLSDAARKFITTDKDREQFELQAQEIVQKNNAETEKTIRAELSAKERVLQAELNQGDTYTKRARPTVIYGGLAFIFINYVLFPILGRVVSMFGIEGIDTSPLPNLPTEFWYAWGGICGTWVIGRSLERRGIHNRAVEIVTGNATKTRLLD